MCVCVFKRVIELERERESWCYGLKKSKSSTGQWNLDATKLFYKIPNASLDHFVASKHFWDFKSVQLSAHPIFYFLDFSVLLRHEQWLLIGQLCLKKTPTLWNYSKGWPVLISKTFCFHLINETSKPVLNGRLTKNIRFFLKFSMTSEKLGSDQRLPCIMEGLSYQLVPNFNV